MECYIFLIQIHFDSSQNRLSVTSNHFTFVSALVREHQTAVVALSLEVSEPVVHLTEAEVFFEECVAVEEGQVYFLLMFYLSLGSLLSWTL